jgi:hypothetical protein
MKVVDACYLCWYFLFGSLIVLFVVALAGSWTSAADFSFEELVSWAYNDEAVVHYQDDQKT